MDDSPPPLLESEASSLSTMTQSGKRRWLYPRLSRGRFLFHRRNVAYGLIALFTLLPYLRIGNKPAILLDIVHREFTILGYTFLPTDTIYLAILMLTLLLSIFFMTAMLGRVWCGWACPQTVYLEFVFRPIQRLFTGRAGVGGKPKPNLGVWRKMAMYGAYLVICVYLAHTFLAYFVGVDHLREWIFHSPSEHKLAFGVMMAVTGAMMFNFIYFREQMCIIACPYGRFQSVLLDKWSLIIGYDRARGEPRGKAKRSQTVELTVEGDCVDCSMCVQVCPTGIDIREGLQMECVTCAQCIDACDTVMDKIGRPRGLIRYSSEKAMEGEKVSLLRPRVMIYPVIVAVLVTILIVALSNKHDADMVILRSLGQPFNVNEAHQVVNTMRIKITNRSDQPRTYQLTVSDQSGVVAQIAHAHLQLGPGQTLTEPIYLTAARDRFHQGHFDIMLSLTDDRGISFDQACRLLGP